MREPADVGRGAVRARQRDRLHPRDGAADEAVVSASARQIAYRYGYRIFVPGASTLDLDVYGPECAAITARNLATGEEVTGPGLCFGQATDGAFGEKDIDPSDALATCVGELYTCETTLLQSGGAAWARELCATWPDGGKIDAAGPVLVQSGCDCRGSTDASGWMLLGVLALVSRRRPGQR